MEENNRSFTPNDEYLPLTAYFAHLPKARRKIVILSAPKEELVTEIARLCGKSKMTVRRWMYGYTNPCQTEKEKIAGLLQCPVEALFPPPKEKT